MGEFEARYQAVRSRDRRFDGRFFTGVTSTGIYCRPICPARTPKPEHCRFYTHAAAAELAGFRPCRRCRPEASPDSPEWDVRADLVGRGLRLIADGVVDREGVVGLASRLAVGPRHLHRLFVEEVGAPPIALARSRRARLARQLLDQTSLTMAEIAFASGFASVRSFNDTIRAIYRRTPRELRADGTAGRAPGMQLLLRYRPPYAWDQMLAYLAARAIPGVEEVRAGAYRRTVQVGDGAGVLELRPDVAKDAVLLRVHAEEVGELTTLVQRARRLLDLDAAPHEVARVLRRDELLAPLVRRLPGLRLPGAFDGFELAVRAVLGQQVSVAAASTLAGRLVSICGTPLPARDASLGTLFPAPGTVANANLGGLGVPAARAEAVRALAEAVASGEIRLDGSADPPAVEAALLALPGIGPWTAAYVGMRALRDPDAFPAGDLGLRHALNGNGHASSARAATARAEAWRPWRGYATVHLWASLNGGKEKR
ncbi:MAG TPA: AlkA N-terminal domain-containing protein [Actinomycetota bacterium]